MNRRREILLTTLVSMAPSIPIHATRVLDNFPDPNPIIEHCWPWTRGGPASLPFMQIRPGAPCHPMTMFFEGGYRRICKNSKCVNPWHFIAKDRPPTHLRVGQVSEAEGDLERIRPCGLEQALRALHGDYTPATIVSAYRNLRQDGFLKPRDCRTVYRPPQAARPLQHTRAPENHRAP